MSSILTYASDPKVLLSSPLELLPQAGMGQSQKINAVARLILYGSVVLSFLKQQWTPVLLGLVTLVGLHVSGGWELVFPSAPGIGYPLRGIPTELDALHSARMAESPTNPAVPSDRDLKRIQQAHGEGWNPVPIVGSEKTRQFATRPASQRVEEYDPYVNTFLDDPFSRKLTARIKPTSYIRPAPA